LAIDGLGVHQVQQLQAHRDREEHDIDAAAWQDHPGVRHTADQIDLAAIFGALVQNEAHDRAPHAIGVEHRVDLNSDLHGAWGHDRIPITVSGSKHHAEGWLLGERGEGQQTEENVGLLRIQGDRPYLAIAPLGEESSIGSLGEWAPEKDLTRRRADRRERKLGHYYSAHR